MAVEQKRFTRRAQREARNPSGKPTEAKVAAEAPTLEELEIGEEMPAAEVEAQVPEPSADLEAPPGPAVMWQRIRLLEKKVEILWLGRGNSRRQGTGLITWQCKGSPDRPDLGCDVNDGKPFIMENTPHGVAKNPALVCPKHGAVPFDPVS